MKSYSIGDYFKSHFKENSFRYVLIIVSCAVGVCLGIYFAVSGFSYVSLLTSGDKNMFGYISGTAEYGSIFWSRFLSLFLCVVLIFCFNIIRETAFLNYFYLAYQMCLIVLSASAIITVYGLYGIINVILFVVPINLVNFCLLSYLSVLSMDRAYFWKSFRTTFVSSFKEVSYVKKFLITLSLLFVFCIVYSFVFPLILKSFVVVNY